MENEFYLYEDATTKDMRKGWRDRYQWCKNMRKEPGRAVLCEIKKEDRKYHEQFGFSGKNKLLCFDIIKQGKGKEKLEAQIGAINFIFFVCKESCADKLCEVLNADSNFMRKAENCKKLKVY